MSEPTGHIESLEAALASLAGAADVDEALDRILDRVREGTRASSAFVLLVDADRLSVHRWVGIPPAARWVERASSLEGTVVASGHTVVVANASGRTPLVHGVLAPAALIAAPMAVRRETIGVLGAARPARPFDESERAWMGAMGSIGGIALDHTRLLAAERRRVERAEVVSSLSAIERTDPVEFCRQIAGEVVRLLDVDSTDVLLLDEAGRELVLLGSGDSAPGPLRSAISRVRLAGAGPLQQAFLTGQPYAWDEASARGRPPHEATGLGLRAIVAVPIPGEGVPSGLFVAARRRPKPFVADDEAFLRLVAARLGLLLHQADVERARAETRARQDFLAIVSHELKTPLAVIRAYGEVLERRLRALERADDELRVLERIRQQADHSLGMIGRMLDLQRLEAGLWAIEESRFDLAQSSHRVADELQATTTAHRLVVESSSPCVVLADRRQIDQVLTNLVDNAIKYSPRGGDVTIRVGANLESRRAIARVSDRGVGIPAHDMPRLFDRFFQGRDHLVRGRTGLGIGLFIAHQIVSRHGGHLGVQSRPGHGSTFTVSLPLAPPIAEP